MGLAHWLKLCFYVSTQMTWGTKILNPFGDKLGLLQGGCISRMGLYSVSGHAWNVPLKRVAVGLDETKWQVLPRFGSYTALIV